MFTVLVTVTPLLVVRLTGPIRDACELGLRPATQVTAFLEKIEIPVATMPAMRHSTIWLDEVLSRAWPVTLTVMPCCPIAGLTCVMNPRSSYLHKLVPLTIAPVFDMMMTSPLPSTPSAAVTLISVSENAVIVAWTPPKKTCEMLLPPPRKFAPEMTTFVPTGPLLGSTVSTLPA